MPRITVPQTDKLQIFSGHTVPCMSPTLMHLSQLLKNTSNRSVEETRHQCRAHDKQI